MVDFLVAYEHLFTALLVATLGGFLAGTLAGKRGTEILREEHIESIRPTVHVKHGTDFWGDNGQFTCNGYVAVDANSKPAKLMAHRVELWCTIHRKVVARSNWSEFDAVYAITAGGGMHFKSNTVVPAQHRNCSMGVENIWLRFTDSKGYGIWEQSHRARQKRYRPRWWELSYWLRS